MGILRVGSDDHHSYHREIKSMSDVNKLEDKLKGGSFFYVWKETESMVRGSKSFISLFGGERS